MALVSCKRDPKIIGETDYPQDIGYLFLTKCANKGCHNTQDKDACEGFDISSWQKLFEGYEEGAAVVPYRSDFSPLFYHINTFGDLGLEAEPTMPENAPPLSRDEVLKIRGWINKGAPDRFGNIKFADNPQRKKFYVINGGCRVCTVFDAATLLPMRDINITDTGELATPHQVKVSPDGKYWYVCYFGGNYIKRYRTSDDGFDAKIFIGNGQWASMSFTADNKYLFVTDYEMNSKLVKCNLSSLLVENTISLTGVTLHGSVISGGNLYLVTSNTNYLLKTDTSFSQFDNIVFPGNNGQPAPSSSYNGHEIIFSPDGNKYYVSCISDATSNKAGVYVFNSADDGFIQYIPTQNGAYEMSFSAKNNLLFVSSYEGNYTDEDGNQVGGWVAVVDPAMNSIKQYLYPGNQPHGIAADDNANLLYVADRNVLTTAGSAPPHHSSVCGGKNGNVVFINMNTLDLLEREQEVSVDPYYISIRF